MTTETMAPPAMAQTPERAAAIHAQARAALTWLAAQLPSNLGASTDSAASPRARLLSMTLGRLIPQIRDAALERLDETDPIALEVLLGAVATMLESIIYHAPGDPLPRFVIAPDEAGKPRLVPLVDELAPAASNG